MDRNAQAQQRMLHVLGDLAQVDAVGLAGSHAMGLADELSDLDLQVFSQAELPSPDRKRSVYGDNGLEVVRLSHPVSAGFARDGQELGIVVDWVRIEGLKCDVLWLPLPGLRDLLLSLESDVEQLETAAVLAKTIKPLCDPNQVIKSFIESCPEYSAERARKKTAPIFGHAHFFLCEWKVLETLIRRKDIVAYQKAEAEMVSLLVSALYAVNRAWQLDQRRLRFHARSFDILPAGFLDRLEAMVMRRGPCQSLEVCHDELRRLFADLAVTAMTRYPQWHLPLDWAIASGDS